MNRQPSRGHDRVLGLAASAIDFDLTAIELDELESHVTTCPACRRSAEGMRDDARAARVPTTVLPSRRVDDAVLTEIARRNGRPRNLLVLAAATLLLLALLAALAVGASLLREAEALPISIVPTPPVVVVAPTPTPLAPPDGTVSDPEIALRVSISADVSAGGRVPTLTVYRHGTVLRHADAGSQVSRLAPGGLALLLAEANDSALLVASGDIGPDPAYQGGYTTFAIDFRRGGQTISRSTTNSLTPQTRTEGEALIVLAEHLLDLEGWLPAGSWVTPPARGVPYIPTHLLLKVTAMEFQPGIVYEPLPLDASEVDWPLDGELMDFGQPVAPAPLGAGTTSRCDVVTPAQASAVQAALAGAIQKRASDRVQALLGWQAGRSQVWVSLVPVLPEEPPDCDVDAFWP